MSSVNANKIQAIMIALDQDKAFEWNVNENFLSETLDRFEYGPEIMHKIKTVYQNTETQVKVNGHCRKRI